MSMGGLKAKPPIRHLVLWLTTDCNLSCSYCYRGEQASPMVMSRETALAALELAAEGGQPFHLQMAGGEPTLEAGLIEFVAGEVRKRGWPATMAVQTNAVALTSRLIKVLRQYEIGVGVSLDGPPQIQERLRGKAADTLRGMNALERAGVDFGVTAVVNNANLAYLPQLALLLSRYEHAKGLGLDLLVRRGRAAQGGPGMVAPRALAETMKELTQVMAWINRRRSTPLALRELERIKAGTGAYCQAAVGASLAVHPNGRMYPCAQAMGDADLSLGSISNPDFSKLNSLSGFVLRSIDCGACPLEGRCPGECPSRLKYNGPQAKELACAMLRGLAPGLNDGRTASQEPLDRNHAAA